jgi:cobalt-zinc-cadmium efflux system outer membrane protein
VLPAIPIGPLALDTAVRIGLLRSPVVQVVLADVGLAEADLWQASTLPNPALDLVHGFPGSGVAVTTIGFGLGVVRALQLPLRRRVAAAELAATELRVADAILGVMIDVQRAYVRVQHGQQLLELRRTVADATAASAGAAKALRDAGNVPALLLDAELAMAAESATEVSEAEGALATARAEMERLLGAGVADTAWTIPAVLSDPVAGDLTFALLDSLAIRRRLDVAAAREGARAAAAALGLSERFRLLPDGTIGLFLEREPDGRFAGPTVSVPVPLFDQGGAAVARARAMLRQRVALHDALVVTVHAEVRARLAQLRSAEGRARQQRTVVLPLRRRVVDETQRHVNAMDVSVFALLQAKQSEIDAGRLYLDALRDYWMSRAELERATGGVLPASTAR